MAPDRSALVIRSYKCDLGRPGVPAGTLDRSDLA